MFWKRAKPAPPFTGSAYDFTLSYLTQKGYACRSLSDDAFELNSKGANILIRRQGEDIWLDGSVELPIERLPEYSPNMDYLSRQQALGNLQSTDINSVYDLSKNGNLTTRIFRLIAFQGHPEEIIDRGIEYLTYIALNLSHKVRYSFDASYYVNGKPFNDASRAIMYFMSNIKKFSIREINADGSVTYDTGTLFCTIPLASHPSAFYFTYSWGDFKHDESNEAMLLNAALFSFPFRQYPSKTSSCTTSDSTIFIACSGNLSRGTEATPIFNRMLAEIYQVAVDQATWVKEVPGLTTGEFQLLSEEHAIEEAKKYHVPPEL